MDCLLSQGVIDDEETTITYNLDTVNVNQVQFVDTLIQNSDAFIPTTINTIVVKGKHAQVKFSKLALLKLKRKVKQMDMT